MVIYLVMDNEFIERNIRDVIYICAVMKFKREIIALLIRAAVPGLNLLM